MATIYVSLGSNIGDREANLQAAIAALPRAGVNVMRVSSLYETEPVDFISQAWFLNCVVEGETKLAPLPLLHAFQTIERQMGSRKEFPKGPRMIDLDLLLYGSETIALSELQVPHPRMLLRRFVLVPLAEIAPALRHPSWSAEVSDLLANLADKSEVRLFHRGG